MRILFFGDAQWAVNSLKMLLEDDHSILGVVIRTRPTDGQLADVATERYIPVFQPANVNAPEFVEQVQALQPELNISVSYDQILRAPIRQTAQHGFINFHAGKLPFYRGRNVLNWALINGETEIGITGHYVDDGIDTGDIITQQLISVDWADTYADLLKKTVEAIPPLVKKTVRLIANGEVKRQQQADLMGSYFATRGEGDEWIDWSDTSRNIYNKIRGITHPGPGSRTLHNGKIVTIWQAVYEPDWPTYLATPGQVVGRKPGEGVYVKTGDSTILIKNIQFHGEESEIPTWRIGTRLGVNLMAYVHQLETRVADLEMHMQSNP
jgi:methionyl-tRNA formyltransferase